MYNFLNNNPWILVYADTDPPAGDPPAGDPPAGDPPAGDPPAPDAAAAAAKGAGALTFSQEDVNRFMAEERRKGQKNNEKTIADLKKLTDDSNITTKQKEELSGRITQLQNEYLTKEEQQKRQSAEQNAEFQKSMDSVTKERDLWKSRHTTSTIVGALQNAAVQSNAFNPDQVVALLQSKTRLVETLDSEGNPTGLLEPRVAVRIKDKDDVEKDVEVPVTEAVKQLVEQPDRYGNLFKDSATGGVGGTTRSGGAGNSGSNTPPTDPAAYKKWREKNSLPD